MVSAYVKGTDEKTRMMRRNIVRYCVLSQALVFRDISLRVRKRFPTIDSLISAGIPAENFIFMAHKLLLENPFYLLTLTAEADIAVV